ncbi:MAG: AraC family transcriptional regulator [Cyanobacteria bacterium P01_C01_bin.89]
MSQPTNIQTGDRIHVQQLQNGAGGEALCHLKNEHSIFISLRPRPIHYVQKQDGKLHTALYQKGEILITPADVPLSVRWEGEEDCLEIRLADEFLKTVARETLTQDCDRLTLQPTFQIRNPQLESIGSMLLAEYQNQLSGNSLCVDSLANLLAIQLLREHTTTNPHLAVYEGGLPQHQLRQVIDYIEASLNQDIKLADLAGLIDISQFHFSRLFKQSLGLSPHRYLLQQRLEKAKQLLKNTDRLIIDIALECGFNNHSHLSKQFKQMTGVTPKVFRASQR